MCSKQCAGIAKTGLQCKIMVKNGEFCHHHMTQANGAKRSHKPLPRIQLPAKTTKPKIAASPTRIVVTLASPTIPQSKPPLPSKLGYRSPGRPAKPKEDFGKKAGFIYLYTLASLMQKDGGKFFKTRNLEPTRKNEWVDFSPKRLDYMFVKVGMTTKTVDLRLLQWEKQCNHKLVCLHPGYEGQEQSLVEKLKRLSITRRRYDKHSYSTFQVSDKGFYAARNVWLAEQEIHALLKKRYGGGPVYCQGCVESAHEGKLHRFLQFFRRKEDLLSANYKVHVEWFPIPKKELREVFRIVDSVCMRYTA
uniref:DUF1766-domain-containing protein n=1 Tax=Candidozyma auris TaxID=498019 RepID=A0A0L0NPL1_CANAR